MTPDDIAKLPYRPCVGVMLLHSNGSDVFVGERIDTPGAWQMPQGGIDPGESVTDAALRELGEETGVASDKVSLVTTTQDWLTYDLPHDLVPKLWKGRFRGQKQKWVLMRFEGADDDIQIDQPNPEFGAWRWLKTTQLLDHIVPFKREVYAQILAAFADDLA